MTEALAKVFGTTDWRPGDQKISSSRVIMYSAFALVASAVVWAGVRVTLGGQPYAEMQVWIQDVISAAKWFLAPYGGSIVRDAVVGKQTVKALDDRPQT